MTIEDLKPEPGESSGSDTAPERVERPEAAEREPHPRDKVAGKEGGKDLRSLIKGAVAEHKDPSPARQAAAAQRTRESGKFAPETAAVGKDQSTPKDGAAAKPSPEAKPVSSTTKPDGNAPPAAPQAPAGVAAPAAMSKEVKAIWDSLPAPVQAEFAKREADTAKGVEQLKAQYQARYQSIEEALAPVRPLLQQRGMNEGHAVKQLFDWHAALAGPNKVQAFRELARSHGVDLSTLAPQSAAAPQTQTDPTQAFLSQHLDPVLQKVTALESDLQRRDRDRANSEIASFSKDKPHFERVRVTMGRLISSGEATGLDDAYQKATWADPQTRTEMLNAEQAKREADAQAAAAEQQRKAADAETERRRIEAEQVAKARKAGVGPRAGSPSGSMQVAKPGGKSVKQSLMDAVKDARASI